MSNSPLNFPYDSNENKLNRMGNYAVVQDNGAIQSLFRSSRFVPFPKTIDSKGEVTSNEKNIHNDSVYNITINDIINYTSGSNMKSMRLTAANFAYLTNVGVYPNNRLLIARRFPSPVGNDLTAVNTSPMSTLISWVPNDENFIEISFGEKWDDAAGSFETVLNGIGNDTTLSEDNRAGNSQLGTILSKGANIVSMPGLMEGIQRQIIKVLGLSDDNDASVLPHGNPNLIKAGKQRTVVEKGKPGSGLKCSFSVKMKVEIEQKFINGVDPTLAYFDLLANVLSFATSDSQFMYNKAFASGATGILGRLISGDIGAVISSITDFVKNFIKITAKHAELIVNNIANSKKQGSSNTEIGNSEIDKLVKFTLGSVIGKYKMSILGVISSLTGVPSTPWHITIGNPKRPFFSSGDMYMSEEVKTTFGPILAFNDLPEKITIEFTLKNARPIGAQEIFNRFNTGKGRSYVRNQKDFGEANTLISDDGKIENITTNDTSFGKAIISDYWNAAGENVDGNIDDNGDKINSSSNNLKGNGKDTPFI